ncbi:MAG: type I glyceraldehyde-3-phosphate dehydrogenase [Legionellales bacterium]|nr:type I glyceraldehyde-3-phosphate dehydrogenase [Legionellales bacterium]
MSIKVAINGFGRIGRNVFRAFYENYSDSDIEIVAVNDLADLATLLHLLEFDSVHGHFDFSCNKNANIANINGKEVKFFQERDPKNLPWQELGVDVVLECTGFFTSKSKAQAHIEAGAKKVIISAPAGTDIDATIVYGVNHGQLRPEHKVISNASCTTNCLAPLVLPLQQNIGIESGLMTTIHAYTSDQSIIDVSHKDLRRARAAGLSMIPTNTGAAAAIGLVIPELLGKLDGFAMRVPTANVSVVDLTFQAKRETTVAEVNKYITDASSSNLAGILAVNERPLVSVDFNHNSASSVADLTQTRVVGCSVKVLAWYDNEWGFANRMIDTTLAFAKLGEGSSTKIDVAV